MTKTKPKKKRAFQTGVRLPDGVQQGVERFKQQLAEERLTLPSRTDALVQLLAEALKARHLL